MGKPGPVDRAIPFGQDDAHLFLGFAHRGDQARGGNLGFEAFDLESPDRRDRLGRSVLGVDRATWIDDHAADPCARAPQTDQDMKIGTIVDDHHRRRVTRFDRRSVVHRPLTCRRTPRR